MTRVKIETQLRTLIGRAEEAHEHYYASEPFTGPSLYFHHRALDAARAGELTSLAEYSYAVLASRGMHRMGRGGAKMREFGEFQASLSTVWPLLRDLQCAAPSSLDSRGWKDLEHAFRAVRCWPPARTIVGNSKVLAHAIPNLVPPIDREYTLRFLTGRTYPANGIDAEWRICRTFLSDFFYPALTAAALAPQLTAWLDNVQLFPWNTSSLKILDNLVIGLVRFDRDASGMSV